MHRIGLLLLCGIVLTFCAVIYVAYRAWRKISRGKRIASILLLTPHFLLIVCILTSLAYGHPPSGSPAFNTQFVCGVLIVFFLPLPALVGTLAGLALLTLDRSGS